MMQKLSSPDGSTSQWITRNGLLYSALHDRPLLLPFLPRDAVHNRGKCGVCPSVCHVCVFCRNE